MPQGRGAGLARIGRMAVFLRPTWVKLIFLVEWALFILIELVRGDLDTGHQILVAGYPLVFFYLVACGLTFWSHHGQQSISGWKLLAWAAGLAAVDQLIKGMVISLIPYQQSVPVIPGWLHLTHVYNLHGSWIFSTFNLGQITTAAVMVVAVIGLLATWTGYKYYLSSHQPSVWATAAFLCLFAGLISWVIDMGVRGWILDFIHLPGVVTADFKDILIGVGAAALFAEWLISHERTA